MGHIINRIRARERASRAAGRMRQFRAECAKEDKALADREKERALQRERTVEQVVREIRQAAAALASAAETLALGRAAPSPLPAPRAPAPAAFPGWPHGTVLPLSEMLRQGQGHWLPDELRGMPHPIPGQSICTPEPSTGHPVGGSLSGTPGTQSPESESSV